jgi:hypothetical protein
MNKKPDNVVDNPGILPYGSNIGAPSISVPNIENWKGTRVANVNKQFKDKYNELKKEYEKLIEEYNWNEIVYNSKFNFEPLIGETYHLYYSSQGILFLSLISPNEWSKEHVGSFKYNHDNKWVKIET